MVFSRVMLVLASALLAASMGPEPVQARDVANREHDEIAALQQRLTDAGCYQGAADGIASPDLASAIKTCPDQEPVLRIETGMHAGAITHMDVDAACRVMATASDDKTVRLWSMPEGRLLRTQRLPIGAGRLGQLYAVAVAPDGNLVAAGGWDASAADNHLHSIYVFDAATGQRVQKIGPFENVVLRIAFSPDGARVAVALGAGKGVHVMDVASGREVMADTDFGHGGSYGLAFGAAGALYATGLDGFLRRYEPDGRLAGKVAVQGGKRPYSLAVDPSGRRLAIGFVDTATLELVDAKTLKRLAFAETKGDDNGDLSSMAWSVDGTRLFAGGSAHKAAQGADRRFIRRFDASGHRLGRDVPVATNTITTLARCGDAIAYAAADPAIGLLQADGAPKLLAHRHSAEMRGKIGDAFTVSGDGTRVRLGLALGESDPVLVDLTAGQVVAAPRPVGGLAGPEVAGLPVTDWQGTETPKFDDNPLPLAPYEHSHALAIRPDRMGFALGADYRLLSFDASGQARWAVAAPSEAWGVNLARGGDLVVAAYTDGTIRWHRWSDGQELLALFIDRDDKRFVAWTPTGYYMASPGAEDLIGWHVNRGWRQAADFFPASRFREKFNRPDIVRLALQAMDEDAAVHQADARAHRPEKIRPLITHLPPVLRITSPAPGGDFGAGEVSIHYAVRSPSGLAVDRIDVLVDGIRQQDRGFDRIQQPRAGESQGTLTAHLPAHDVTLALVAHAGDLSSEPSTIHLAYSGAAPAEVVLSKPKLYALVAGISDYRDASLKLGYASKDARDFGAVLQRQAGGLYGSVEIKVIVDGDATRLNLIHGLKWLQQQVTNHDVGMVFLAGHGATDPQQGYWFLPVDATPDDLDGSAVSQDDIKRTLNGLAGKAVLFLDSCHAGQIVAKGTGPREALDINKVVGDFAASDNGVVVFASSMGREVSQERDTWGNGAFTKALIEGVSLGKADIFHNGTITVSALDAFVVNRVTDLTAGGQHPVMTRPTTVPDYAIAAFRK